MENNKEKPTGISRINKLTYGLIYPAFIGNMIYDLIQFQFTKTPDIHCSNILYGKITGLFFVLFFMLDYVHIHSDLDYKTTDKQKDIIYILGDFVTSCLFFAGFVSVKYGKVDFAIIFLILIPIIFAIYNCRLQINKIFNILFFSISIICGICYFFVIKKNNNDLGELYLLVIAVSFTVIYFFYNSYYYWCSKKTDSDKKSS